MKDVQTYLIFDGNCRDAMTFYQKCLGGELSIMPFSQAPGETPVETRDRVMHARLNRGSNIVLMASDTMPGHPFLQGNNFSISIQCENAAEADRLFAAIEEKGKVTMPLQDTFWGAYFGMVSDKFGINWMFNFQKDQQH